MTSIRIYPNFNKLFKLYTDISNMRLGAVLTKDDIVIKKLQL